MVTEVSRGRTSRHGCSKHLPATISLVCFAVALSRGAFAVEPGNVTIGPVNITPTVEAETRYIDNLYRSRSSEQSTWASEVAPEIQAWVQSGPSLYSLSYELKDYRYFSQHQEDFTDHKVNLDIAHQFTSRHKIDVVGEYLAGHEETGTGLSEGVGEIIGEPVEFDRARAGVEYTYGNQDSAGRLVLAARALDLEYGNFREQTQYFDRAQKDFASTFFVKVAPRTDVLAEVRYIDNEYDRVNPQNPGGSLDSEEYNYFVGVEWQATASTSGNVRLGGYDRSYDSSGRDDDDGFSWEVGVTYWPRTYSRIDLGARRFSEETNGLGDFINTREFTLDWKHDWGGRSSTYVTAAHFREDYSGANRDDDFINLELGYTFAARRWLDLGMGYRLEDRDSNLQRFDYTRNAYFLELELSL
ncbi:hypothetical protein C0039_13070 [Pseudohalioglobus lutimaris]|uniref:Outer membrane beta-barrel protein n=1 Tax=Pseudohalioglobus lutimaris TaxID=1737061 RepID=A0A2N5X1F0_9GAMM|nr:hypothetical protein C0039_13070 [Pseudohalioglobus lutimaris]